MKIENVIMEIEDALSGNLAKAGNVYNLSLNGLKDKALTDALVLLKEQEEEIENLKQIAVKPTIDEYGKAYCVCGENVGIIPNNKNLPSVFAKYCPECGRRMMWNEIDRC